MPAAGCAAMQTLAVRAYGMNCAASPLISMTVLKRSGRVLSTTTVAPLSTRVRPSPTRAIVSITPGKFAPGLDHIEHIDDTALLSRIGQVDFDRLQAGIRGQQATQLLPIDGQNPI